MAKRSFELGFKNDLNGITTQSSGHKQSNGIKRQMCLEAAKVTINGLHSMNGECRLRKNGRVPSLHKRRGFSLTLSPVSPSQSCGQYNILAHLFTDLIKYKEF